MYKVRFNLGKGDKYMTWKVTYPDKSVNYLNPSEVNLNMKECKLKNNAKQAELIFNGANKRVCAWIECEDLKIKPPNTITSHDKITKIAYNPRIKPYWTQNDENVDNKLYKTLITIDNKIYLI